MLKMTSRSEVVLGIVFAVSGLMYLAAGRAMLACVWLFCSAVHFIDAYRFHCREKDDI